jgi:RES domain-containing protein
MTSQTQLGPPFCAGVTDELRLVYLLEPRAVQVSALKAGTRYTVEWFNPVEGVRQRAFELAADAQGKAVVTPPTDDTHDWALVVKREKP